jgi:hypothetical protein
MQRRRSHADGLGMDRKAQAKRSSTAQHAFEAHDATAASRDDGRTGHRNPAQRRRVEAD